MKALADTARTILGAVLAIVFVGGCTYRDHPLYPTPPLPMEAQGPAGVRIAQIVESVERLDSLRAQLAAPLSGRRAAADEETFRAVHRPVEALARKMARDNGWVVEQLAEGYRSSAHRPDPEAREILALMAGRPELIGVWLRTTRDSSPGVRYFRRITVLPACLACHGPEEERPWFVFERYPDDRAFGFRVGDLRGAYAVFMPEPGAPGGGLAGPAMGAKTP